MKITDECVGCGGCISGIDRREPVCPFGSISLDGGRAVIDHDRCRQCGRCIECCGVGAIVEYHQ